MSLFRRAPAFWDTGGWQAAALAPVAAVWGAVAGARMNRPPTTIAPVPVVVVGNLTAGGAGKTPLVAALVDIARGLGRRPAVLTRGWGGRLAGPVRVDLARHGAAEVGDEPLLHARRAPTIVARDRRAGLSLVAGCDADLLILDDGFQSTRLRRDLSLVVVDAGHGIGNGRVLPAGPLRAPLARQLDHTDALVVVHSGEPEAPSLAGLLGAAERRDLPILTARLVPQEAERFAGRRFIAFAGIGRPAKFAASLRAAGAEVVELVGFADHAPLSEADAETLLDDAATRRLELVTTEKDLARLAGAESPALRRLAATTTVMPVDLVFDDPAAIARMMSGLGAARV